MGRGHSGSTVLDCLLNGTPGVCGIGEAAVGLTKDLNSLGAGVREDEVTQFWNSVKSEVNRRCHSWPQVVHDFRRQAHLRNFLPTLFRDESSKYIQRAIQSVTCLYDSVRAVSGSEVVVDSSKEVTRALLLAKHFENAHIIHLVRYPHSVFSSDFDRIENLGKYRFLRRNFDTTRKKPLFAVLTMCSWVGGSCLAEIVKCFTQQVTLLRFEDLREYPIRTLNRLEAEVGISFAETKEKLRYDQSFSTGIGLRGNRMRRENQEFHFRTGASLSSLDAPYNFLATVLTGLLTKIYGYGCVPKFLDQLGEWK